MSLLDYEKLIAYHYFLFAVHPYPKKIPEQLESNTVKKDDVPSTVNFDRSIAHGLEFRERSFKPVSLKHVKSNNKKVDSNHLKSNVARPSSSFHINQTAIICTKAEEELFNMLTTNVHAIQYR
jgi:hypothetical protein